MNYILKKIFGKKLLLLEKELEETKEKLRDVSNEFSAFKYHLHDGNVISKMAEASQKIIQAEYDKKLQEERLKILQNGYDLEEGDIVGRNGSMGVRFISTFTTI